MLHFHFFSLSCRIASVTSYLKENEAENPQGGNVHFAQIADSRTILCTEVSDGSFFAFSPLFHLSLTLFKPGFFWLSMTGGG